MRGKGRGKKRERKGMPPCVVTRERLRGKGGVRKRGGRDAATYCDEKVSSPKNEYTSQNFTVIVKSTKKNYRSKQQFRRTIDFG